MKRFDPPLSSPARRALNPGILLLVPKASQEKNSLANSEASCSSVSWLLSPAKNPMIPWQPSMEGTRHALERRWRNLAGATSNAADWSSLATSLLQSLCFGACPNQGRTACYGACSLRSLRAPKNQVTMTALKARAAVLHHLRARARVAAA